MILNLLKEYYNNKSNKINKSPQTLLEKGTDYRKQAINIIVDSGLFNEDTATKIIDGLFRQDIHAFNHAPAWMEKYLKGIARMLVEYCNGDSSKAQSFLTECPSIFNDYLEWVKSNREKLGTQLDDEFNNKLHYKDIKDRVEEIEEKRNEQSQNELSKMKFNKSNYSLVPINSFEEFKSKYGGRATGDGGSDKYAGGEGTAWCHANNEDTYMSWVAGGTYKFFVLQKK